MTSTAPASELLKRELSKVVKNSGLVFWLDAAGRYTQFAQQLQREPKGFPYPVVRFDGSFLELMFALERHGNGLHRDKVLVHMPGFNNESIADTPVYELYKAGQRHERALDTLVKEAATGVLRPDDVAALLKQKDLTLAQADAALERAQSDTQNRFQVGLESRSVESVLSELFTRGSKLVTDLVSDVAHAEQLNE